MWYSQLPIMEVCPYLYYVDIQAQTVKDMCFTFYTFQRLQLFLRAPAPKPMSWEWTLAHKMSYFLQFWQKQQLPRALLELKKQSGSIKPCTPMVPKIYQEFGYKEVLWHHNNRLWNPEETSVTDDWTLAANLITATASNRQYQQSICIILCQNTEFNFA